MKYINGKYLLLVVVMILVLCAIRLVHLGADSPSQVYTKKTGATDSKRHKSLSIYSDSAGIIGTGGMYVDEGYKTLSPRNLILFGSEHWHPEDDYTGWMIYSPFTQWAYYGAFKVFGVNIKSARFVTIIFFFILLCFFAFIMSRYYESTLFYSGLIILGLQSTIFFFSRTALFEISLAMFVYCLLFVLKELKNQRYFITISLVTVVAYFTTFFVKKSALLYLFPVLIGTVTAISIQKGIYKERSTRWIIFIILTGLFTSFAYFTSNMWLSIAQFSFSGILKRVLLYPPIDVAPVIVIGGLFCAIHGLLYRPKDYFIDVYRTSLLCIIFLSPLALAFFKYNPTRYYVPILPAYILICLEWIQLKSWNDHIVQNKISKLHALGIMGILFLLLFYCSFAFNLHILSILPINFGDEPGISFPFMLRWFTLIAFVLSILIYSFKKNTFSKIPTAIMLSALLISGLFYNFYKVGNFLLEPSYQSMKIGSEMSKIIPSEASITGDWAPLFALNTKIRALYMSDIFNTASKIKLIRPDYFVYTSTIWSNENMQTIMELEDVFLGEPVYESQYIGKDILIYPIKYED